MKRIPYFLFTLVFVLLTAGETHAEQGELRIAKQYGLGYLQMIIMEDQQMVEKQARAQPMTLPPMVNSMPTAFDLKLKSLP